MAQQSKELPRDVQSVMHDIADKAGEMVARGEMIDMVYPHPDNPFLQSGVKCTCERYSEVKDDNKVVFWNEVDPKCAYMHLQPLPDVFTVTLP